MIAHIDLIKMQGLMTNNTLKKIKIKNKTFNQMFEFTP